MAPVRGRFLALILVAAGCSLDFTVRPQPNDAGGSPPDGGGDDAQPIVDGGSDVDVGDVSVVDTGTDGAVDCNALKADLDDKRRAARLCQAQTTAYCQTTVPNECDCQILVSEPTSAATYEYVAAINKFKASQCVIVGYCPGTCPTNTTKQCLFQAGVQSCYP